MTFETIENWALHAFADGELEGEERKAMEKLLSGNDEARKALAAINFQKAELRKAYSTVLDEPVPVSLLATVRGRNMRGLLPYAAMAASVALVLLGSVGGWFAAQNSETLQTSDLARRAFVAHTVYAPEIKHPVEVAALERVHLQAWLSKRVGAGIIIPTLDYEGYELLGGRLLAGEKSPAGQLMYETADKQRLTVFIGADVEGKEDALRLVQNGNLVTCYWRDGKLAIAVTGEMAKDDMMALAKHVYEQMDKG
jgi:anti-sigma factor RsiW